MSDYRETLRRWRSTALRTEDIASLSDADLDDWLWTRLCDLAGGSAASVGRLPSAQRSYYATRLFEWEVMNGGLHQYFLNHPEPELLDLVLDGYRLLGLEHQATVVRELVAPLAKREASWRESLHDGTIATFMESYVESALPEFDDRIEEHDAERLRFVRSQPYAFRGLACRRSTDRAPSTTSPRRSISDRRRALGGLGCRSDAPCEPRVTARLPGVPLDLARLWHESSCCPSLTDGRRAAAGRLRPAGRPAPLRS